MAGSNRRTGAALNQMEAPFSPLSNHTIDEIVDATLGHEGKTPPPPPGSPAALLEEVSDVVVNAALHRVFGDFDAPQVPEHEQEIASNPQLTQDTEHEALVVQEFADQLSAELMTPPSAEQSDLLARTLEGAFDAAPAPVAEVPVPVVRGQRLPAPVEAPVPAAVSPGAPVLAATSPEAPVPQPTSSEIPVPKAMSPQRPASDATRQVPIDAGRAVSEIAPPRPRVSMMGLGVAASVGVVLGLALWALM